MPRHRLEPGESGEVTVLKIPDAGPSPYRARAKVRMYSGQLRRFERWGRTRKAATAAVTDAIAEALATDGVVGASSLVTFDDAARAWLDDFDQLVRLGQRSPSSAQTYRYSWERYVSPALGELRLPQVTVPVVDRFLVRLHRDVGPSTARTARAVVSSSMGYAVRQGAAAFNPARDVRRLSVKPKKQPRALMDAERSAWFLALAADPKAVSRDLPELSAFMLATGLRIGEALAVIWQEVDLDAATVSVTSTLVRLTGSGLLRKRTKTEAGQRPLMLPAWCVAMLRRRAAVGVGPEEPVFGTVDGGFRDPRNISRWFAEAREAAGLDWVTSHVWRKTTASILDNSGIGARVIADQLGHSRVSMTQDVYLGRRSTDPRVVAALEAAVPPLPSEKGWEKGWNDHTESGPA